MLRWLILVSYTGTWKKGEVWRGCPPERTEKGRNGSKVSVILYFVNCNLLSCKINTIIVKRLNLFFFSPRWSKREEVDFYRTVTTFGVEFNKKEGTYDWSRFRWVECWSNSGHECLHMFLYHCQWLKSCCSHPEFCCWHNLTYNETVVIVTFYGHSYLINHFTILGLVSYPLNVRLKLTYFCDKLPSFSYGSYALKILFSKRTNWFA